MADRDSYYDVLEDRQKSDGEITPSLECFLRGGSDDPEVCLSGRREQSNGFPGIGTAP